MTTTYTVAWTLVINTVFLISSFYVNETYDNNSFCKFYRTQFSLNNNMMICGIILMFIELFKCKISDSAFGLLLIVDMALIVGRIIAIIALIIIYSMENAKSCDNLMLVVISIVMTSQSFGVLVYQLMNFKKNNEYNDIELQHA